MDILLPDREVGSYFRQGLISKIWVASNNGQNGHFFLKKKGTKNLTTPYSVPFLSVLHQNKTLHSFHKRGDRPTGVAACINEIESI